MSPMQYTAIFSFVKSDDFPLKKNDIFLFCVENIDFISSMSLLSDLCIKSIFSLPELKADKVIL